MSARTLLPHYLLEADLEGYTAWADDGEDFNQDKAEEFIKQIFGVGYERVKQLTKLVKPNRDGNYWIPNAAEDRYASFEDQVNYQHMVKNHKWLHTENNRLTIDPDKAKETHGDLERYLAAVDPEEWDQFIEDLEVLTGDYPVLDEEGGNELERKAQEDWAVSDGMPDLRKELMALATDSFSAFVISQVRSPKIFWEWCQEVQTWPERDGDHDVYMNVEKYVEPEHVEWFLDQLPNLAGFQQRWKQIKREFWDSPSNVDGDTAKRTMGDVFDDLVRSQLTTQDPECLRAYSQMDHEDLYRFFLRLTPDGVYHDDSRPRWLPVKDDYGQPFSWVCTAGDPLGYDVMGRGWRTHFATSMKDLLSRPEAAKVLRQADRHEPLEHPELPLGEAAVTAQELLTGKSTTVERARLAQGTQRAALPLNEAEPDLPQEDDIDPEAWLKRGGDLRAKELWRDAFIQIVEPLDQPALNSLQTGKSYGLDRNPGQLRYEFPVVIMALDTGSCLGAYGLEDGQFEPIGMSRTPVAALCADPTYGKSVRKGLIKLVWADWREALGNLDEPNDRMVRQFGSTLGYLNKLGGNGEMQRFIKAYKKHPVSAELHRFGLFLGLKSAMSGNVALAAEYLKPDPSVLEARGAWLSYYDGYSDLAELFDNESAAKDVFNGETYDWFIIDDSYGKNALSESIGWLSPKAYAYLRDLLINRNVYFPEGGVDGQGEWVILTRELLKQYSDDDLWEWMKDPSEEEESQGTYDDIVEALISGMRNMLESASRDHLELTVTKKAIDELDSLATKFVEQPGKPDSNMLTVLVPWKSLMDAFNTVSEDDGSGLEYDSNLSDLMLRAHHHAISFEHIDQGIEWPNESDSSADYYRETCSSPLLELERTRFPENPDQAQLKLGDSLLREINPVLEAAATRAGVELFNVRLVLGARVTLECDVEPALTVAGQVALQEAVGRDVYNALAQQGVYTTAAILDESSTNDHPRFLWSIE